MTPYTSISGFEALFLEDSFVLDIEAHPSSLTIRVDLVLTEQHQDYTPPKRNEQYCYRTGSINFEGVSRLYWLGAGLPPATDADNEKDYGGIDEFGRDGDTYVLAGAFGQLDVEASRCVVELGDG